VKDQTNFFHENIKKIIFKIAAGVPVITLYFRVVSAFFRWKPGKIKQKLFLGESGCSRYTFSKGARYTECRFRSEIPLTKQSLVS